MKTKQAIFVTAEEFNIPTGSTIEYVLKRIKDIVDSGDVIGLVPEHDDLMNTIIITEQSVYDTISELVSVYTRFLDKDMVDFKHIMLGGIPIVVGSTW